MYDILCGNDEAIKQVFFLACFKAKTLLMGTVNWEWKNWDLYRKKLKFEADQIGKKIKEHCRLRLKIKKKIAKFRK